MDKKELYDKVVTLLKRTEAAVYQQDVSSIIDCMKELCIDNRMTSALEIYAKTICIEVITKYMTDKKKDKLRIKRKGVYNEDTYDFYVIDDGVLKRNGTDVKWSSLGKLYQAYKYIKKK